MFILRIFSIAQNALLMVVPFGDEKIQNSLAKRMVEDVLIGSNMGHPLALQGPV
jgi:hypothetical protein